MFRCSLKGTGYPLHSPVSPFTPPAMRHSVPSHFNWSLPRSGWQRYATPVNDIKAYRRDTGTLILSPNDWTTGHDYWHHTRVVVIWAMTPCCLVGRYQHIGAILSPWPVFNVLGYFKAESMMLISPSYTAGWTGRDLKGSGPVLIEALFRNLSQCTDWAHEGID